MSLYKMKLYAITHVIEDLNTWELNGIFTTPESAYKAAQPGDTICEMNTNTDYRDVYEFKTVIKDSGPKDFTGYTVGLDLADEIDTRGWDPKDLEPGKILPRAQEFTIHPTYTAPTDRQKRMAAIEQGLPDCPFSKPDPDKDSERKKWIEAEVLRLATLVYLNDEIDNEYIWERFNGPKSSVKEIVRACLQKYENIEELKYGKGLKVKRYK
tara:strand:+ start:589 stop:1221 length:633 start_codon:yes stop_codon:yes gene_type:complete